jgi:hypothetical protein
MTQCHGQYRRAGAALRPGTGRAGFSAPRSAQQAPFHHRSQDALARQEITHITRRANGAACNPAIIRPGDRRLLRDNTLHAIWLHQKAHLGSPRRYHSTLSSA